MGWREAGESLFQFQKPELHSLPVSSPQSRGVGGGQALQRPEALFSRGQSGGEPWPSSSDSSLHLSVVQRPLPGALDLWL